ncbi:TetR/AcrR family transcriptional regulator [Glutamicibacter arilaitensis]|uniref:TetR/AcrR family transcriptional regulator n=1 Tax=Glutamicibacter arilaitensis TaxID=256701 RepID=UPI003F900E6C
MPSSNPQPGRRERNKREKLERIIAAASELFATYGVDEVTTQQIADAADIATGTLFLYAKSKSELLLMVQNHHYEKSLEQGIKAAQSAQNTVDAVMALLAPIIDCNRKHVGNGRVYLREMAFGDSAEPHHHEALRIAGLTERAIAELLGAQGNLEAPQAAITARVITSIQFLAMAATPDPAVASAAVAHDMRAQIAVILRR